MQELPEATTLARQLRETVRGRRIAHAEANHTPHGFAFYWGDPQVYGDMLAGRMLEDATAHGMFVAIRAQDMWICAGDGAHAHYIAPGAAVPARHQLCLTLDDGAALVWTVQMYGMLWATPGEPLENSYYRMACEKASPLTEAFDEACFEAIVRAASPKLSAKALLATEQRIPGLGNGTLQDVLYNVGIHPKRKVGDLTDEQLTRLFHSVKNTLAEMTAQGGRDTERDLFGQPGGYQTQLSSKTWQQPCLRCGGAITRQAYMGGNVYFCAACQPL